MPKSVSLIERVLNILRRFWRLAGMRMTNRELWRETRHVEAFDSPMDLRQAGERGRAAWFELVRRRAPHLLAQGRLHPQPGRDAIWGSRPIPPKPMPSQEEPEVPVAQVERLRPERAGIGAWLPFKSMSGDQVTASSRDMVETESVSPRIGIKPSSLPAQEPISASWQLRRKEEEPPFIQKVVADLPQATEPGVTPRRQPPEDFEPIRTPREASPVVQSETSPIAGLLKQSLSTALEHPSASVGVREQPLPVVPGCDTGGGQGVKASADPWFTQRRERVEPFATRSVPVAQTIRSDVEAGGAWLAGPVEKLTSAPLCKAEDDAWRASVSTIGTIPLSSPRERWPSLLPDRQPDAAMMSRSVWRDDEHRRRLRDEQRGVRWKK